MKRSLSAALTAAACVLALFAAAPPGVANAAPAAPDTFVTYWDDIASQAVTAAALPPPDGHTVFAYEAVAVYDSVMAVSGKYEPFAIIGNAPKGASVEAAVAASAHDVLAHYLPAQAATIIDPALVASLGMITDGKAETDGVALGHRVAAAWLALRADDGFRVAVPYTPPDPPVPGVWLPTAATPAVGTYLPAMRPFALASADQFRPDGPPALGSRRWARDYNEVKDVGSATSTTRTPDQTTAAKFWQEPPVQQAHGSFRLFIAQHGLDVVKAARFMAMVSVTIADALVACFDAKYHYAFWRPITAIRAGDTDGNDATEGDPAWTPLLPATPNHPDYPSAHSCLTPASAIAIQRFLGTRHIDFTVPSLTGLGDRHFATVGQLTREVSNARVWGGIHFRTAVQDGVVLGKKVAREVLSENFGRAR